jgi:hypothetical protein
MRAVFDGPIQILLEVDYLPFEVGVLAVFGYFDRFNGSVDEMMAAVGEMGVGVACFVRGGRGGLIGAGGLHSCD